MMAYVLLLVSAFTVAFSVPAGRVFLATSLLVWIMDGRREGVRFRMPATGWIWVAFVAWAVVTTAVFGVSPGAGLGKTYKLLWFAGIPLAATLVTSPGRLVGVVGAFAAGTGVMAVWMIARNVWVAHGMVATHKVASLMDGLVKAAGMSDAQRMVMGIVASLGLIWLWRARQRRPLIWWVLLVLQVAALLLTFKRGAWLSAVAVAGLFILLRAPWRYLAVMAAVVLVSLLIPTVRTRIADLKTELGNSGGRMTMWTRVAPVLVQEHPWGVGYWSLTPEMMKAIEPGVEPNRNHLHSNPIEVLVEVGWPGLALYLLWMAGGWLDALRLAWRSRGARAEEGVVALSLLLMMTGLFLNGLVEYNFGDAELILPLGLLMGAAAGVRLDATPRESQDPPAQ